VNMLGGVLSAGRGQKGFTAIEVLLAVTIAGLIGGGVVTAIALTVNTSVSNSDHTIVVDEFRNAVYWIRRDAKMAQIIQIDAGESGLPMVLSWVEWDNSQHEVTYDLSEDKLMRTYSIDGSESTLLVAENVDPALTSFDFAGGMLTFDLTISVGDGSRTISEGQECNVDPRPGS
jgi:prepilin-type N-terminal cleavage/methylation domain-containing protein